MRSETPIEVRRRVEKLQLPRRRTGFEPAIAALRKVARHFEHKVEAGVFKHAPLERIFWQKWSAFNMAADYLACLKK